MLTVPKGIVQGFSTDNYQQTLENQMAKTREWDNATWCFVTLFVFLTGGLALIPVAAFCIYEHYTNNDKEVATTLSNDYSQIKQNVIDKIENLVRQAKLGQACKIILKQNDQTLTISQTIENNIYSLTIVYNGIAVTRKHMSFAKLLDLLRMNSINPAILDVENAGEYQARYLTNVPKAYIDEAAAQKFADRRIEFDLNAELNSIRLISALSSREAQTVAFNRDMAHINGNEEATTNETLLATKGSAIRLRGIEDNPYIAPNAQVSVFQRTTLQDDQGRITHPYLLSVSPPALEDVNAVKSGRPFTKRPEMSTYLIQRGSNYTFNDEAYREAHNTLGSHVIIAAQEHTVERVVLSAYGVGAFLNAIRTLDDRQNINDEDNFTNKAMGIAAASFAETIAILRSQGKQVCFATAHLIYRRNQFNHNEFWKRVNDALEQREEQPVDSVSDSYTANWSNDTDLIVNEWDPHALIGNGMKASSPDGPITITRTSAHLVHALACYQYNNRYVGSGMKQREIEMDTI